MEQAPQPEQNESRKKIDIKELRKIRQSLERESDIGPGDTQEELQRKIAIIDDKFREELVGTGISLEEAKILLKKDELRRTLRVYEKDFHLTEEELKKPLLEVGAANGDFIKYIRETFGNTNAWGVDIQESKASKYSEGMVVANGIVLPFEDGVFDIVIAKDYMSMFYANTRKGGDDPTIPLKEMLRVASIGGKVTFNTRTPEKEIEIADEYKSIIEEKYTEQDEKHNKERYDNAILFFNHLSELENKGHKVTVEDRNGRTIVSIIKK